MTGYKYILLKQTQWALGQDIRLVGSKGKRGRPAYTAELNHNLFEPLEPSVRECFLQADGKEIRGSVDSPAKMHAVHSSSALCVNVFQYWLKIKQVPEIAAACGFSPKGNNNDSWTIVFENKYPVDSRFRRPPNIDVVIRNSAPPQIFAVECKFSEAYSSHGHGGLKPEYLERDCWPEEKAWHDLWDDIPHVHSLAKSICPDDNKFTNLHAAQLIKHMLGLKRAHGKNGFELLYLWYDVLGQEGVTHGNEIADFAETATADGVKFHAMSYQELFHELSSGKYGQNDGGYIRYFKYLTERYL